MGSLLGLFVLLAVVIVACGVALTHFADRIAEMTAMGHSLAGLLLLAAATSLPELSVGWAAVRIAAPDLALGELLGSCLWNLLLLAILDLSTRTRGRMFSRDSAAQALLATVTVLLAAIIMMGLTLKSQFVFLRISPLSWSILLCYVLCVRLVYRDHGNRDHDSRAEVDRGELSRRGPGILVAIAGFSISAALIFFAAPNLATVADQLAEKTGWGDSFLGVAFVALVTSLPEAVTTLAAIRLGHVNMAVANIFGSNAFNLTIVAALDFASPNSLLASVAEVHLISVTAVILVTAVALLGILYRAEKRYWLIEPDAVLVITLLIGAMVLIYRHSV
jgi:cation:H+ antiporter